MVYCRFTDEFIGDYQVCNCGRHLWSIRAQRVIIKTPRTKLTSKEGDRVTIAKMQETEFLHWTLNLWLLILLHFFTIISVCTATFNINHYEDSTNVSFALDLYN
jgi:C4-dicarboxylate transporter